MARKKEVAKAVETTEEVVAAVVEEVKAAEATTKKTRVTKATKAAKKAVEEAAAAVEEMEAAVKEVEEVPIEEAEPAKPEDLLKTPTKVAEQIAKMCNPDPSLEEEETKEDKFHRIASARTSKVLDSLRILGHCSNLSTYEYTEVEVDKMFTAIRRKLDSIENNFREKLSKNQEVDFKF